MSTDEATNVHLLPVADARRTTAVAWRLVRARRASLALTIASFLLTGFAGVVPVLMIGRIVDAVREGGTLREIVLAATVMVVAGLAAGLFSTLSSAALAQAVAPALAELREDVLDRALHLESQRIEQAGIGDVLSRVGDDVRKLTEALDEAIPLLLGSLSAIGFTVGGLFTLDWRLGLAGLAAAPCYVLALRWYLPRSIPYYRAERTAEVRAPRRSSPACATPRRCGRSAWSASRSSGSSAAPPPPSRSPSTCSGSSPASAPG